MSSYKNPYLDYNTKISAYKNSYLDHILPSQIIMRALFVKYMRHLRLCLGDIKECHTYDQVKIQLFSV